MSETSLDILKITINKNELNVLLFYVKPKMDYTLYLLIAGGVIPNTPKITTIEEAQATFDAILKNFKPSDGEKA